MMEPPSKQRNKTAGEYRLSAFSYNGGGNLISLNFFCSFLPLCCKGHLQEDPCENKFDIYGIDWGYF